MEWALIAICALILGVYADKWLAERPRRPLSHMRPDAKSGKSLGMEDLDLTRAQKLIQRHTPQSHTSKGHHK